MSEIREIAGALDGTGRRFAVVASRFNARVVAGLISAALDCLERHGVRRQDIEIVRVPGAWEIPLALEEIAARGGVDGMVALGALVRGETPHFDVLCAECTRGVGAVARAYRIPVGFGILTCDSSEQARERAGGKAGNKGWEAALAALEMADLLQRLHAGAAELKRAGG